MNSPFDDDGVSKVTERFDRRAVLKGLGSASLVGSGVALSSTAGADQGDGTTERSDASERTTDSEADDEEVRTIDCGETVAAQFTEDDPRNHPSEGSMRGVRQGTRYHEYRFEGYTNERVGFSAETEVVGEPEPDDPHQEFEFAGSPVAVLLDADDEIIAYDPEAGHWGFAGFSTRLPADGTYRLVVTSLTRDPTWEYVLRATCSDRTPVTDRSPEPVQIECGETVVGEFTDDDVRHRDSAFYLYDVYEFDGECGDSVTISTRSAEEPLRPRPLLFDPDGRYDGPRFDPERGHVSGAEATFTGEEFVLSEYRLPKTGTYTIWVSSHGAARYEYELSLEC